MQIYYSVLLFIIGSVLGSFYTVLGTRAPEKKSIIKPRSHCDYCGRVLTAGELIPIISYIIQGGKCRGCKKKIDPTSTICEFFLGTTFALSYLYYGFTMNFYLLLIILSLLAIIFISDFKYMVILDSPLIVSVILVSIIKYYYLGLNNLLLSYAFGLIVFGVMFLFRIFGNMAFKKESLGGGDIKLSFLFGLISWWQLGLLSIAVGSFIAFPIALYVTSKKESTEIPFGPYLILGFLIVFFFGEHILKFIGL